MNATANHCAQCNNEISAEETLWGNARFPFCSRQCIDNWHKRQPTHYVEITYQPSTGAGKDGRFRMMAGLSVIGEDNARTIASEIRRYGGLCDVLDIQRARERGLVS